jgi:hypothetical protein
VSGQIVATFEDTAGEAHTCSTHLSACCILEFYCGNRIEDAAGGDVGAWETVDQNRSPEVSICI